MKIVFRAVVISSAAAIIATNFDSAIEIAICELFVGIVLGLISFFDLNRSIIKFHEKAVCLAGNHLSYKFVFLNDGLSPAIGCMMSGAVVMKMSIVPALVWSFVIFNLFGNLAAFTFTFTLRNTGWMSEDLEAFVRATSGSPSQMPQATPGTSEAQDVFVRMDKSLEELLTTKPPDSMLVGEFEIVLIELLKLRASALDIHSNTPDQIMDKMKLQDVEERKKWLSRFIDEEVWAEISPPYTVYMRMVIARQNNISTFPGLKGEKGIIPISFEGIDR